MRRFIIALLSATAVGAVSANAADLPVKAPPAPAPAITVYNWTGCYVGGNLGGGWAETSWTNTANTTAFGDLNAGQSLSANNGGFIGGGHIGCNYQMQQFVFGIEGSFAGSTIKGDTNNNAFGAADDVFTNEVTSIATVVGRIGYAWDNWLLYAKGGYAGGEVKFSVADNTGANTGAGSDSSWQSGWTVGGGVEYGFTPNWIFGLEYNYLDLGTQNYQVSGAATSYAFDVDTQIHEVLARISYKFWP